MTKDTGANMKLALGYIPFLWPADKVRAFYLEMAEQPLDIIYLGEAVCSKRRAIGTGEWIELGRQLAGAGKQAVLSSLALIEAKSELANAKRLCENGELMVEANDMAAVQMMHERGMPFVTGNGINIYNAHSLRILFEKGLRRWVFPVELSALCLQELLAEARDMGIAGQLETEVLAYGHLGLAYSARCFTARAHDLPKDQCGFVCKDYPAGMALSTQEDQQLFILNGIQVMSGDLCNLLGEVEGMRQMGVDVLRLNPTGGDMRPIIDQFRAAADGLAPTALLKGATDLPQGVNGYWHGRPGMNRSLPWEDTLAE
ncbi:MAG: U32 family peptidase [Gammaproteobacteria bacterium]|nr:U32 family peptidase [Gammaproteobacteria bacterium]